MPPKFCFLSTAENVAISDLDVYEGDMILDPGQRMIELELDVDNPFGRGSTINRQWPDGVAYYVIDSILCKFITTMEPRFNEPLYNEVHDITNDTSFSAELKL